MSGLDQELNALGMRHINYNMQEERRFFFTGTMGFGSPDIASEPPFLSPQKILQLMGYLFSCNWFLTHQLVSYGYSSVYLFFVTPNGNSLRINQ